MRELIEKTEQQISRKIAERAVLRNTDPIDQDHEERLLIAIEECNLEIKFENEYLEKIKRG